MNSRDEYVGKMKAKLDEWNAEIDSLTVKADEVAADARSEYKKQIESLKVKQTEARQKIEDFQQAGEIALKDFKSGIDKAWDSMGEAIKQAKSRFS